MSVDLTQFHQVFLEESFENLDAMEDQLMALDPFNPENEVINSIFRAAHSIKGGAGTFGFAAVAEFTHLLETLLDEVRAGKRGITQEEVDLFLQAVDCLRDVLQSCQQGVDHDRERVAELSKLFLGLMQDSTGKPIKSSASSSTIEHSQSNIATSEKNANRCWSIQFSPHRDLFTTGNEPLRIFRVLAELGELKVTSLVEALPSFDGIVTEQCYLSWRLELSGNVEKSQIEEAFEWVFDQADIVIEPVPKSLDNAQPVTWNIEFIPNKGLFRSGNDPVRLLRDLSELGSATIQADISNISDFEHFHPEDCYLSWHINLESRCQSEEITKVFEWVVDDCKLIINQQSIDSLQSADSHNTDSVTAVATQTSTVKALDVGVGIEAGNRSNNKSPAKMESSSIRVAIDKIDSLINMVGELVITQSMLGQIGGNFTLDQLPRLLEGLSQLEHNTRELQESVMRIRMLPISFAFSRFPRMVRDLSRRLNKQIELVLRGEQTELDKTVMERIGDPLVHLVRNAIDHGIENPEERSRQGKSPIGTIVLNAYHQSGNVVIEIQDDGRGINREKLLEKARAQGLVANSDGSTLSDSQVFDLIFHPGLSTAAEVSDVSGRGVGMDVVKRNIQELNGTIDIKSHPGVGTTITVRLPLTLAILDGQLVRVGDNIYIFPLVSIVESIQVKADELNQVAGGCEVFQLRNEYIPVVRLYEVFSVKPDSTDIEDSLLVVVEGDGEKIGVVVDELSAQQQVVIKSLEQNYQRIEGVSGATILGDGTVSLILDIPGIVKLAGHYQLSAQHFLQRREGVATQAIN